MQVEHSVFRSIYARKYLALTLLCLLATALTPLARAGDLSLHAMRSAYLFNFTKFVTWSPNAAFIPHKIRICLASSDGQDHFQLATINNQNALEQKLDIFRLESQMAYTAEQLASCQILFINEDFADWHKAHEKLIAKHSLLVTEGKAFKRGAIHLHVVDNKLRFEIAKHAALTEEYKISSKLMRLSRNER